MRQGFEPHRALDPPVRVEREHLLEETAAELPTSSPDVEVLLQPFADALGHHLGCEADQSDLIREVVAQCSRGNTGLSRDGADGCALHPTTPDDAPHGSRKLRATRFVVHDLRHPPFIARPYRQSVTVRLCCLRWWRVVASELGVLVGLALADSTSIGTLVIPIWLLMRERLEVGRILLYLVVIAGFYWVLSLALLAFVTQVTEFAHTLQPDRSWSWIQLAAGVIVLGLGIWTDRRPGPSTAQPSRAGRWRSRTLRLDGNRAIIGLALTAGVLEAATMLPLLAAVGMIERSTFSPIESALAVSGYVAIMMLPAIALLAVRVGIGERAAQPLAAAGRWLERQSNAVIATILIVLGGLVAADAAIRLDLVS